MYGEIVPSENACSLRVTSGALCTSCIKTITLPLFYLLQNLLTVDLRNGFVSKRQAAGVRFVETQVGKDCSRPPGETPSLHVYKQSIFFLDLDS